MGAPEQAIIDWIRSNCSQASGKDITEGTKLLDQRILDSLQIVQMADFLESHFGVSLAVDDIVPDNFDSPVAIAALVQRRKA